MPLHPLTNSEKHWYYQNEQKLKGVYSKNYLLKVKDGTHLIYLD